MGHPLHEGFPITNNSYSCSIYSQNTRFTLARENVTIENILSVIEDQSEFYFLYNGKLVDVTQKVNIKVENQNIEKTLNELLRNSNIYLFLLYKTEKRDDLFCYLINN